MITAGNTPCESSEEDSFDSGAQEINDISTIPVVDSCGKKLRARRVGRPRKNEIRKMTEYRRKLEELRAMLVDKNALESKARRSV